MAFKIKINTVKVNKCKAHIYSGAISESPLSKRRAFLHSEFLPDDLGPPRLRPVEGRGGPRGRRVRPVEEVGDVVDLVVLVEDAVAGGVVAREEHLDLHVGKVELLEVVPQLLVVDVTVLDGELENGLWDGELENGL